MYFLLQLKDKLKRLYGEYSFLILPVLKFFLAFVLFRGINGRLPYVELLGSMYVVLILSLICSILPMNVTGIVGILIFIGQCYGIGIHVAGFAIALVLVLLIFYVRFAPKDMMVLLFTPFAFVLRMPCLIPVGYGLNGSFTSAISSAIGVILYYFMELVRQNAQGLTGKDMDAIMKELKFLLDGLLKNHQMMVYLLAFVVVVLLVQVIGKLAVDYARQIGIGVGAVSYILTVLIGAAVLDAKVSFGSTIIGTIGAVIILEILEFFLFQVDYKRTENLQYEDDEYVYYVKAVPKVTSMAVPVYVGNPPQMPYPVVQGQQTSAVFGENPPVITPPVSNTNQTEVPESVVSQDTIVFGEGMQEKKSQEEESTVDFSETKIPEDIDYEAKLEETLKNL